MNALSDVRLSSLWVQRTHEKFSLQSKGIHANCPLWSFKNPGARHIPRSAAIFVRVVSWSALLKYSILPVAIRRCWTAFRVFGEPPPTYHKRSHINIAFRDNILFRKRIIFLCYEINAACKNIVYCNIRKLFCMFLESKENITLIFQKTFQSVFVAEYRCDLCIWIWLCENPDCFGKKIQSLSDYYTYRNIVPVFTADILSLFNCTFQILTHIRQETDKLHSGRC